MPTISWGFPNPSPIYQSATYRYKATLVQAGTADPIAYVRENTLGWDIYWMRNSDGIYTGYINNATPWDVEEKLNNYAIQYDSWNLFNLSGVSGPSEFLIVTAQSPNDVTLGIYSDNLITWDTIEITYYAPPVATL